MGRTSIANHGQTLTVRVPITIRRRGGRKVVLAPDGTEIAAPLTRHVDNAMVKAIARAFRWREMLENGSHSTIAEIAAAEKINESLCRSRPAADPAGAGHRRGDPGRVGGSAGDAGEVGAADSGGVDRSKKAPEIKVNRKSNFARR